MYSFGKDTMTELNIVELIENHPISKLTNTYNLKLLDKIKKNFTDTEQQLFIASFYCYLNYDTKTDFVVDLDNIWKWLGFTQKNNASMLLEKNFILDIHYKNIAFVTTKAIDQTQKSRGGHNIKKIMMTIKCFKLFCIKAQTKKASEIHEYYLKLEDILHEVIEEEGKEFKLLLDDKTSELEKTKTELKATPELERHRVLLQKFAQIGSLVYIVRIKQCEKGKYIIKIGESRKGIRNRMNEFKQTYGSHVIIMDCFPVHNSVGLEKYLHHHSEIHPHKVKDLDDHESEQELFMMGGELTYQRLLQIIETAIPQFDNLHLENQRLQAELDKVQNKQQITISMDNIILGDILKTNQLLLQKVLDLESTNKDIISRLNSMQTKTTTACSLPDPHIGPRLQKIHPETLEILNTYETVTECMKEDPNRKRPSLNKASRENSIYRGFRWQLVDRNQDLTVVSSIAPTKVTKVQKNGYIAKINAEKTEIINIYLDRKTASICNKYPSISSLDGVVKNHTIKDGYYYQLYEECEESLRSKWKELHGVPVLYRDGVGQYDANKKLISEYVSRYDCTVRLGISQKSLAKVLDKDLMYHQFYIKSLGEKLCI